MKAQNAATTPKPLVLCLSGHDPTGGAGIHADIEAVAAQGGHALSIITAHTVQDTSDVRRVVAVAPILIAAQLEALLGDCTIQAIKIGLIGDAEQIPPIVAAIRRARVPVVLDPVLRAGGGSNLAGVATVAAMQEQLFPLADLLTPNAAEARRLVPQGGDVDACAVRLLADGCRNLLVTGGDEPGERVVNRWYAPGAAPRRYEWPRLPGGFHGAGCTLASAIAALLAGGASLAEALERAQAYTHRTLERALAIGQGRSIPARVMVQAQ